MLFSSKDVAFDVIKGVNTTGWGGVQEVGKVGKIVKRSLFETGTIISAIRAFKDFGCQDYVCGNLDIIARVWSTV